MKNPSVSELSSLKAFNLKFQNFRDAHH